MRQHQSWFFGIVGTILVMMAGVMPVVSLHAQTTEGSIRQQPSTSDQQAQLRQEYQTLLAQYREDEKAYTLANQEYQQLETLAALEKAVQATKKVMSSRDQVLLRFLNLLKLELIDTNGVTLSVKSQALTNLDAAIVQLTEFETQVSQASDKPAINQLTVQFEDLSPVIESRAYAGLSLVSFGKMQTVYDKTTALLEAIQVQLNQESTSSAEVKQRGVDELKTQLAGVKSGLDELSLEIEGSIIEEKMSQSRYNTILRDLQPLYAHLSQIHNRMGELL